MRFLLEILALPGETANAIMTIKSPTKFAGHGVEAPVAQATFKVT
jgi:hypothetical protein